jgi:oxygen-independent coproporphyrinogen-3 oxidase
MQNADSWDEYADRIARGELALSRAYRPTAEERLIREFVLQLKRGSLRPDYFTSKYGVDVLARFREPLASLAADGHVVRADRESITLSRPGLLRVDTLLRRFFLPGHADIRYT